MDFHTFNEGGIMKNSSMNLEYLSLTKYITSSNCMQLEQLFDNLLWDVKQVAKYLKCSVGHIYNLKTRQKIPYRKKQGKLRFIPSEIINWIEEGESTDGKIY